MCCFYVVVSPLLHFVFVLHMSIPCLCDSFVFVCCVLVYCRHCSPVHYFFSMFTAHHWASLSVCLPNLHPKFQLFIYNQLVRYCTDWSLPLPQHLHLALPYFTSHPMEHACVHPLALGRCGCGVVNDAWLNVLVCLGFLWGFMRFLTSMIVLRGGRIWMKAWKMLKESCCTEISVPFDNFT